MLLLFLNFVIILGLVDEPGKLADVVFIIVDEDEMDGVDFNVDTMLMLLLLNLLGNVVLLINLWPETSSPKELPLFTFLVDVVGIFESDLLNLI